MGEMSVETFAGRSLEMPLDRSVSVGISWDPHNPQEVGDAKSRFTELVNRGYLAFGGGTIGAERMLEFEPEQGAAIFGDESLGKRVGVILQLNKTGHVKVLWDPHNPISVEAAEKQFKFLRDKGFLAHKVNKDGTDNQEIVHTFDPKLEHLSMSPAPVGG